VVVGIAFRLVFSGRAGGPYNAMMGSFTLLVPVLVGAVTVVTAERTRRRSWAYYFFTAALSNALLVFGALALSIEGLICCVLAVPLFAVLGGISGLLTGALCRWGRWPRNSIYGFAILTSRHSVTYRTPHALHLPQGSAGRPNQDSPRPLSHDNHLQFRR
jgi:hypothetical protein